MCDYAPNYIIYCQIIDISNISNNPIIYKLNEIIAVIIVVI